MRRHRMRSFALALVAVAFPAFASAATLTIAQNFDPQTLWPNGTTASDNLNAGAAIVEPLFFVDPRDDELKPLLATSFELETPTSILIRLREGVTFSNGEAMNADAVIHSVNVFIDTAQAPAYAGISAPIATAEKVDDLTVRLALKFPYPPIELTLSQIFITPPAYWNEVGLERFGQEPIGTGPFVLSSWTRDDRLVMDRNETYWGEPPTGIDQVVWRPVPDDIARAAGLVTGEYDVAANLAVSSVLDAESQPGIEVVSIPSYRIFQVFLYHANGGSDPLDDKRVRQALNYAIDKQAIIDSLFFGRALPLNGQLLREAQPGFNPDLDDYPHDPAKAKELLAEAGFADGLTLTFKYPSGRYAQDREVSEALVGMLAEVGVTAEMVLLEPGEFLRQMRAAELRPMGYMGLGPQNDPDFYMSIFHSDWAWTPTSNAEFDRLIEAARQEMDADVRAGLYRELMALMHDEAPVIFLYNAMDFHGITDRLDNFAARGDGRIFLYGASLSE